MAKKRSKKTPGKSPQGKSKRPKPAKRRRRSPSSGGDAPQAAPPDRRALEGTVRDILPGPSGRERAPLDEAQDIMYEAFGVEGEERIALAEEALAVSPDCADAYVLLAEHAPSPEAAMTLYEQGVAAGERALGEDGFREYTGEFWGLLETRPYMRAREGLAQCLWVLGRKDESIEHYREMLRLNPGDNQGIRYLLAHALLDVDQDEELQSLVAAYEDDIRADWTFTRALLAFRHEGDTPQAAALLRGAVEHNEHVPGYLLGNLELPPEPPDFISLGGEDEAVMYTAQFLPAWRNTPGALTWLRRTMKVPMSEPPARRAPAWRKLKGLLSNLPRDSEEVWQVDARQYPIAISAGDEETVTPWFVCIADATQGQIIALDVEEERPKRKAVWETIIQTMLHPREGDPRRPGTIELRLKSFATAWSERLAQIGIECRLQDELECIEHFLENSPFQDDAARLLDDSIDLAELEGRNLADLPLRDDVVWQADVRRMTTWLEEDGEPVRPRIAAVANCSEGTVIRHELAPETTAAELLWEVVLRGLWTPMAGEPHRPGEIQVVLAEHAELLASRLAAVGIECTTHKKLDLLDDMLADLDRAIHGAEQPMAAMVDSPGVSTDQVGSFFAAADKFYRAAPWRRIPGDAVIRVEAEKLASEPWYAIVMGQSGMTVGLVLYEDLQLLRDLLSGGDDDEENGRKTAGLSVFLDDDLQMASRDLDAAEHFGWPIAGPEAYPTAMRINPGMSVRPPLAWELALLEACLQTVPMLVEAEAEKIIVRLPVDSAEIEMQLAWFDPFES